MIVVRKNWISSSYLMIFTFHGLWSKHQTWVDMFSNQSERGNDRASKEKKKRRSEISLLQLKDKTHSDYRLEGMFTSNCWLLRWEFWLILDRQAPEHGIFFLRLPTNRSSPTGEPEPSKSLDFSRMMHFDQFFIDHIFEFRLLGKAQSITCHGVPISNDT